jgi:Na+-transporting methylmalonyl-CoA/oxaloacetate decarboxylase gamma subunit
MNLLQATAETFNYMVMGYAFILGVLSLYIVTIVVRFRKLRQEVELLKDVEVEE